MPFPWTFYETFDDGTLGGFNSETDASAILTFPNYKSLAPQGMAPYQGAHALRLRLSGTATGLLTELEGFDTAADDVLNIWMPVCIGSDLTLTAGDAVILLAIQSAGPVNEVVVGIRNNGGVYEFFAGETGATNTLAITRNSRRWYEIEIVANIDAGAGNDGTIAFYVDGAQVGATITALDQAVTTQAQIGAVSGTAAGNSGTILIGGIICDLSAAGATDRVFPRPRFGSVDTIHITRDMHAWIGAHALDSIAFTATAAGGTLTLIDADPFESTDSPRPTVVFLRNANANEMVPGMNTPVSLAKGSYVQLTGTNPQAWLSLARGCGAVVKSHAQYVERGLRG